MCKINDLFEQTRGLHVTRCTPGRVINLGDHVARVESGTVIRLCTTPGDAFPISFAGAGDFLGLLPCELYQSLDSAVLRVIPSSQLREPNGDYKQGVYGAVLREALRQSRELGDALYRARTSTINADLRYLVNQLNELGLGYLLKKRNSGVKTLLAELVGSEPAVISRSLRELGL
jgi:hypothetical protein